MNTSGRPRDHEALPTRRCLYPCRLPLRSPKLLLVREGLNGAKHLTDNHGEQQGFEGMESDSKRWLKIVTLRGRPSKRPSVASYLYHGARQWIPDCTTSGAARPLIPVCGYSGRLGRSSRQRPTARRDPHNTWQRIPPSPPDQPCASFTRATRSIGTLSRGGSRCVLDPSSNKARQSRWNGPSGGEARSWPSPVGTALTSRNPMTGCIDVNSFGAMPAVPSNTSSAAPSITRSYHGHVRPTIFLVLVD